MALKDPGFFSRTFTVVKGTECVDVGVDHVIHTIVIRTHS